MSGPGRGHRHLLIALMRLAITDDPLRITHEGSYIPTPHRTVSRCSVFRGGKLAM